MSRWLKSFYHAMNGLVFVYQHEQNFRIHLVAGALAVIFGFMLGMSRIEMAIVILLIIAVLGLELINSALEHFLDLIVPRFDVHVERVKNVLAAVVLLASVGAAIISLLLYVPYMLRVFTVQ